MIGFLERYKLLIRGVLSCYDRVVINGTFPDIGHAGAMTGQLRSRGIRIFDYTRFVNPLRQELREHAERLAREAGLEIEFIRKKNFRKEKRIRQIVSERGDHPGLVHIFSAMEPCSAYEPWHGKPSGKTFLRPTSGKCLHYYFYFIHEQLGLCYLRIPTWAPFRLQFYFNAHNWLARQLERAGIRHTLVDNVFVEIGDFERAQELADALRVKWLHRQLDRLARHYCPVLLRHFPSGLHWSVMQAEYATDIVFKRRSDLAPIYERLVRTAIHAVKAEHVATFLGRKLQGNFQGELGSDFQTRIQGTRIKHYMGRVALKMYDKLGLVLRLEVVTNDLTFFKHYRKVEHRNGSSEMKVAAMKKTIYSLPALRRLLRAANHRYLEFLSALDDPRVDQGKRDLERISRSLRQGPRSYRGFNLFDDQDLRLFLAISRGEFNISGLRNRDLQALLPGYSGPQISRLLKRLRLHGLIKKIGRSYKYYLTRLGRRAVLTALKLRELVMIPSLAEPLAA